MGWQWPRRKTVEWVGGPFDAEHFMVAEDVYRVTVKREDDSEFTLPIVRRGRRYYVVWEENIANG